MQTSIDRFARMVRGRSVAVVGNAPNAIAFDHADRIDACDVVIRFNRFQLGDGLAKVGSKVSVIACPMGFTDSIPTDETLRRSSPAMLLSACPKRSDEAQRNVAKLSARYDVAWMAESDAAHLTTAIGCRPTTGLWTLWHVLSLCEPASVYATGFSFDVDASHHYFPARAFDYHLHDPRKELHFVAQQWPAWSDRLSVDPHMMQRLTADQPSFEFQQLQRRKGKEYSSPHRWIYHQVTDRLNGGTLLEVGAGIGYGLQQLAGKVARLVAIEPDKESFEHTRRIAPANAELHHASLDQFQSAETFDAIACIEVMEHLPPIAVHPFLRKLRTLGKRLFMSSPDRRHHDHGRRTRFEWTLALRHAGWSVKEVLSNSWANLLVAERSTDASTGD